MYAHNFFNNFALISRAFHVIAILNSLPVKSPDNVAVVFLRAWRETVGIGIEFTNFKLEEIMKIWDKAAALFKGINQKFYSQFGFYMEDVSFANIVEYMYSPRDSSSLAITRILFGLLMLFDITEERGGSTMDKRWGHALMCHFPLFPFLKPIPMPYMVLVYAALWIGAFGIMLGYKYRAAAVMFTVSYWYLYLIEKSYWNNHSYLFGIVALLLTCTDANCYLSIDAVQDRSKFKTTVPYWNYFILKYQFFILYFMAGLKKGTAEWLTGYSVQSLSEHWVFAPFKLLLTEAQIDYLIVHWFVFMFDLTISFWMMYSKTRNIAVFFCCLFHLMNVRLFKIGMFPWVCLATLPLFYPFDWPRTLVNNFLVWYQNFKSGMTTLKEKFAEAESGVVSLYNADEAEAYFEQLDKEIGRKRCVSISYSSDDFDKPSAEDFDAGIGHENVAVAEEENLETNEDSQISFVKVSDCKKRITLYLIFLYLATQAFLPYSHFITKGYNTWTGGLYGYSWDMMVHTWHTNSANIIIKDQNTNQSYFLDSSTLTPNDRWTRHGDMVHQYAKCLKELFESDEENSQNAYSKNISIHADVWCSMNGRFMQRLFDKNVDLLTVEWSPFKEMSFVMPLLDEAVSWREKIEDIRNNVYSWNDNSDVIFQADYPGYDQSKYVGFELSNVTLTVLKGVLAYQIQGDINGFTYKLATGDTINVDLGVVHNIYIVGNTPAYYMYTFFNTTQDASPKDIPKLEVVGELSNRFKKIFLFGTMAWKAFLTLLIITYESFF